jgi:hypothetical protein
MRQMRRALVLRLAVIASTATIAPAAEVARLPPAVEEAIIGITSAELCAHVQALAGDAMGGRAVGQPGNRQAEQYVAEMLRRAHAAPAAPTYFQPVELYHPSLGSDSRLTIAGSAGEPLVDLEAGSLFYPLPESADRAVQGPLVFAGHGISLPAFHHDDYARRNVDGAIVLVLEDMPEGLRRHPALTASERGQLATVRRKIADAHAHGAIGIIVVQRSMPDARTVWSPPISPRDTTYGLYSRLAANPMPVAALSGHAAAPVRRALSDRRPLIARLRPGVGINRLTVHNVIAVLEPVAPAPRDMIVVGAHFDHDGTDGDGRIFNGADDNASGTAAVLAMAAALTRAAESGQRPNRRIVFAFWNGEERGSLGAEAYLDSPLPSGRVIANLNLDMIGRSEDVPDPESPRFRGFQRTTARQNANVVHLIGYSFAPDLAALAKRANETIHLTLRREYDQGAQGLLERSDNWPFLKRAIPALFFTTGLHADYHTPEDDAERLDFAKMERITELVSRVAWLAADGEPPRFRARKKVAGTFTVKVPGTFVGGSRP